MACGGRVTRFYFRVIPAILRFCMFIEASTPCVLMARRYPSNKSLCLTSSTLINVMYYTAIVSSSPLRLLSCTYLQPPDSRRVAFGEMSLSYLHFTYLLRFSGRSISHHICSLHRISMGGFLLQPIRRSIRVSHHIMIVKAFRIMVIVTDVFWASGLGVVWVHSILVY
jgi:hypothetical protein